MSTPGAVASGERSVAVGGDVHGLIVTGDHVRVVVKDGGAVGSILDALGLRRRTRTRRRRTPVDLRGEPFADLLGRADEIATLVASDPAFPLSVIGEALVGKTYVVRSAVADPALPLQDGAVLVHGRGRMLDDVLQDIWEAFVEAKPPAAPSRAQIHRDLANVQSLIVIDPCELEHDEAQELARAVPGSRVIVVSRTRHWHDGGELSIAGLRERDATALLARELREVIATDDLAAISVSRALRGHPLLIRQAAGLVRSGQTTLNDLARLLGESPDVFPGRVVASLTSRERALVTTLASFGGETLGVDLLRRLVGPEAGTDAPALADRGVLVTGSPRFGLPSELDAVLDDQAVLSAELHVADNLASVAERDPDSLAKEIPALLALLQRLDRHGRDGAVVRFGRAIAPLLVRTRRLGAWSITTVLVLDAARRAEDLDGEAWALHERGTSELVRGDVEEGRAMLRQAIQLREKLGDKAGAAASRHNLGLRLMPPWYLQRLIQLPLLVITGLIVVLVAAAGAGSAWLLTRGDDSLPIAVDSTSVAPTQTTRTTGEGGGTSHVTSTETTDPQTTRQNSTEQGSTTQTTDPQTTEQVSTEQGSTGSTQPSVSGSTSTSTPPEKVELVINLGGDGHGSIDLGINGLTCPDSCSTSVEKGQKVSLVANEDADSILTTWGEGADSCPQATQRCDVVADERVVLAPRFEPAVSLTVTADGNGSVAVDANEPCQSTCGYKIRQGNTVTLDATALGESTFARWSGIHCSSATCSIQLDASIQASATFEPPQQLTVKVTGDPKDRVADTKNDISCAVKDAPCLYEFAWGTWITLHPSQSLPWFEGWTGGGCSGTGDCKFVLKGPTEILAKFTKSPG